MATTFRLFVIRQVIYNAAVFPVACCVRTMIRCLMAVLFGLGVACHGHADTVAERYRASCAVCHAAGVANAPRTGVPAEWEPILAKGMEALLQTVEQGLNAMPPKGMCFDCSAAEVEALIKFMATERN